MPNETNNDAGGSGGQQDDQGGGTPTWEQVVEALPEEQRALYNTHTQGLRSALQSERDQRSDLARQLREATQQLEQGSAARTQLEQMTAQLDQANRRAEFAEAAVRPEIGCTNVRLAWLAATEIDAFDRGGSVNWAKLKEQFPELFAKQGPPPGNAGAGNNTPPQTTGMTQIIRRAAGIQS